METTGFIVLGIWAISAIIALVLIFKFKDRGEMPRYDAPPPPPKQIDWNNIEKEFYEKHVSFKTMDGIPTVASHPQEVLKWIKTKL